jgi:ornithine cyclodeaminase/alanine dehydrogenase-like protein (mu-crystallin family)
MRFIDREEVARRLTYPVAIRIVREAMIALSRGETKQLLRSILTLSEGRLYGAMTGALGAHGPFGSKVLSAFKGNASRGRQSHQGLILLFDPETGAPVCALHAGEITAIRTAAASAVATDALARPDARRLAVLGTGEQAATHVRAIREVRPLEQITIWGRSPGRATDLARRAGQETGIPVRAVASAREAVADADIVCTVSAASEPILLGAWVQPGTHVNVVGSSYLGPVEVDDALVLGSRFFADSREGCLRQGAEFAKAREAGLIGDDHLVGEIGEVLAGMVPGRRSAAEVTLYKSLGHIVQDLATGWALHAGLEAGG